MDPIQEYHTLLKSKGRRVSEINPGSDECALKVHDAILAIKLLKDGQKPILGGDIFSIHKNQIRYAYQLWGSKYQYLNWYCDRENNESEADYCFRSNEVALNAIKMADKTAKKLNMECLIVLVI